MAKRYHTLLVRDGAGEPWEIYFGDYTRSTVNYERDDVIYSEQYKRKDTVIITTGDAQADIDAAVRKLNGSK